MATVIQRDFRIISIPTGLSVVITFQDYFVTEPAVLVTVYNAVTEVGVVCTKEEVSGVGEVYTYVTLTFPTGYSGKRAAVLICGQ